MRNCNYILIVIALTFIFKSASAQNIGVNSTGANPNASAMLDIVSSTSGLLIPRMTAAQKTALNPLPAAAQGLLIYQTDGSEGFYYNTSITTTPIWNAVSPGAFALPLAISNGGTGSATQNFVDLTTLQNNINGAKTFLVNVTVPTLNTLTVGIGPGTGNATNTAVGISALAGNTTATNVTAIGYQAAIGNTTGGSTVAIGYQALMANTTGVGNTATGSQSLFSTTTGGFNTAYGAGALYTTTGVGNTATGYNSLYSNTSGISNTAIGNRAGFGNTSGAQNTYIGYNTGIDITSGANNTIIGANVTGLAVTLANNIILADGAGNIRAQHNGTDWTLTGGLTAGGITYPQINGTNTQVLTTNGAGIASWSNVTATAFNGILPIVNGGTGSATQNFVDLTTAQTINGTKTFVLDANINTLTVGRGAGSINTTNTAIGVSALVANSTAANVTAIGYQAAMGNTTGGSTVAIGYQALMANTTGIGNTATGSQALFTTTTGGFNTAYGSGALYTTTGIGNTATGYNSLYSNTSGSSNTAIGNRAGFGNTSGAQNTYIGYNTGIDITSGANNTILGANVTGLAVTLANNIILADGSGNIKAQHNGTDWTLTGGLTAGGVTYPQINGTNTQVLTTNGAGIASWSNVTATAFNGILPVANGGTGSATQNFVDLTTAQTINGTKTFVLDANINTLTVGRGAGSINTTNTAIGVSALVANTTAANVTAIGYQAAMGNTTGGSTVAVGYQALMANTTGVSNTATGRQALFSTTTGGFNTAYGSGALFTTTGIGNTATGYHSLYSTTSGISNTAIGYRAGFGNTSGTQNTYIGYNTGIDITSGTNNTILGANVTGLPVTLANNIILADGAGNIKAQHNGTDWTLTGGLTAGGITYPQINGTNTQVLTTNGAGIASWGNVTATAFNGILPVANGGTGSATQNFVDLTTAQTINGTKTFVLDANINTLTVGRGAGSINTANTAIGVSALAGNTTAANLTAIGYQAAMGNTTGGSTVAVGYQALMANTTGVSNTATGSQALFSATTGGFNTAYGSGALFTTTGIGNTATGYHSLYSTTSGISNTAIGYQAGFGNTSGTQNTYIGYNTGIGITSGANNTILGANVIGLAAALANNIILADGAGNIKAQHNGTVWALTGNVQFGSYGAGTLTTDAAGNITASSDERLKNINGNYKKGLAELLNIEPIVYHWNELSGNDTLNTYAGFSAQNIKESIPEAVGIDPRGYLTLSDRPILAATVNAIKEINIRLNEITDAVPDTEQNGLIVQDVEKIYPEVIITDIKGYKAIDYDKLTTLMIGAIKDQQNTISSQQLAIEKMEAEMIKLKTMVMSLEK